MRTQRARVGGIMRTLTFMLAVAVTVGCEVTNPGPVGDEFIALPASQAGLVNGSWERMNLVLLPWLALAALALVGFAASQRMRPALRKVS